MDYSIRDGVSKLVYSVRNDADFYKGLDLDLRKDDHISYLTETESTPLADQIGFYQMGSGRLIRIPPLGTKEDNPLAELGAIGTTVHMISAQFAKTMSWITDKTKIDTGYLTGKSATEFCLNRLSTQAEELELRGKELIALLNNDQISKAERSEIIYMIELLNQASSQVGEDVLTIGPLVHKEIFGNQEAAIAAKQKGAAILKQLEDISKSLQTAFYKSTHSTNYFSMKEKIGESIAKHLDKDYDWTSGGDKALAREDKLKFIEDVSDYQNIRTTETLLADLGESEESIRLRGKDERMISTCQVVLEELLEDLNNEMTKELSKDITFEENERFGAISTQVQRLKQVQEEITGIFAKHRAQNESDEGDKEKIIDKEMIHWGALGREIDNSLKAIVPKTAEKAISFGSHVIEERSKLERLEQDLEQQCQNIEKSIEENQVLLKSQKDTHKEIEISLKTLSSWDKLMAAIPGSILTKGDEQLLAIVAALTWIHSNTTDSSKTQALEASIKEKPEWAALEKELISLVQNEIKNIEDMASSLMQDQLQGKATLSQEGFISAIKTLSEKKNALKKIINNGRLDITTFAKEQLFLKSAYILNRLDMIASSVTNKKSKISPSSLTKFEAVYPTVANACRKKRAETQKQLYDKLQKENEIEQQHKKLDELNLKWESVSDQLRKVIYAGSFLAIAEEMRKLYP